MKYLFVRGATMSKISKEAYEVYGQVYKIWKEHTGQGSAGYKSFGKNPANFKLAQRFIKEYWKEVFDKDFPYPLQEVSGNRYTWYRGGVFSVNTEKGWQEINHNLTHWMSYKKYPRLRPHCTEQAWLEVRGAKLITNKYLENQ